MLANRILKALILATVCACLCLAPFETFPADTEKKSFKDRLELLEKAIQQVKENYAKEITDKELVEGAINGMLQSLDPHSSYLSQDFFQEFKDDYTGEFGGLGIEVTLDSGVLTIVSPIEDTPAYRAGLKSGDRIVKIDGESTKNITLMQAVKKMRGPRGTKITLTIMRQGTRKILDFTVVRDIIHVQSVKSQLLEPGYAFIRIANFQESTDDDLEKAIKRYGGSRGLKGVILDLRNNPGGLLDQAVKVANVFIEKGLIVYTDGRVKDQRMEFSARRGGYHLKSKLAVLINQGSASASEIVAGAVQDYNRGLLFGVKSFGKASVQTIINLRDGSGLRLTTAYYYTPKGRHIQKTGIQPDVNLEKEIEAEEEKRLAEEAESGQKEDIRSRFGKTKVDPDKDIVVRKALDWLKSKVTTSEFKRERRRVTWGQSESRRQIGSE